MENLDLIALLLTVIALIIAIWIMRKVLIIVAILIVFAVIAYFVLTSYEGDIALPNKPVMESQNYIEKFKENYCEFLLDRDDSLTCFYIVEPIYERIKSDYDEEYLNSLTAEQAYKLIFDYSKELSGQIRQQLQQKNALYLWQEFKYDLKAKSVW